MKKKTCLKWGLLPLLILVGAAGCGEKIAIPEPTGLYALHDYLHDADLEVASPRGVKILNGYVFLLQRDTLSKMNRDFELDDNAQPVQGFSNATALCGAPALDVVFVFDRDGAGLSWYSMGDLAFQGSAQLPEVLSAAGMEANDRGIELAPSGATFLYISDPVAGVIHRFAFDGAAGPVPHGILARSGGESARFVQQPAGLANGPDGEMVVCDADTLRNWVIRFDSAPDTTDVGDMRGLVTQFRQIICDPQPTAAYVLGDAPECGESAWQGGPSNELGELHRPVAAAVDGSGRVFVSDSLNHRIQVFAAGVYELSFNIDQDLAEVPGNIALYDYIITPTDINWGAYVFVVLPEENLVRKFISAEENERVNPYIPPPPE